jgi:cytochrome b pre-mRNA-processing protein 3
MLFEWLKQYVLCVYVVQPGSPSAHKTQILELLHQFQAAMVGYDEGLLSDDMVLAGAVWRTLLQQDCSDPENVERIVYYIRKQVRNGAQKTFGFNY